MTNKDTTPTSGTADLPEALHRSTAADGKTELFSLPGYPLMVRAVDFNRIHAESEMRRAALLDEMQKAALAAGQATAAQQAPATQQAGEVRRAELVPGVMHCAKCKFQLNRVTLCVSDGNAYAGNNKTEPCPNGCGPLWPVTWEQEAKNCWKALEEMHERLMAAAAPQPTPTAQSADSGTAAEASRFGSPELQAMIIARCVEKDQAESVYAFRRKGLDDFCTCDEARYEELSNKPHLFETRVFYTAPQPSHGLAPAQPDQPIACSYGDNGYACCEGGPCQADVHNDKLAEQPAPAGAQADSVQEDAALWHWLAEYLVGTRTDLDDEIVASETVNDLRKLVKAAIKQGEKQ